MKKHIFVVFAILLSTNAFAVWSGSGQVTDVYSHKEKIIISTTITGNICGTDGKFWWSTTSADSDEMYTMALTALMGQNLINVVFNDSEPAQNCLYGGDLITHMKIRRL